MGKLAFYLEAFDRDHKRPHENPSIGVLLCRSKNDEVVEYGYSCPTPEKVKSASRGFIPCPQTIDL